MTYSIVARCDRTGQLGVAVATHWLATGARVPWVHGGVGAVASQGTTDLAYGMMGLQAMSAGLSAQDALRSFVREDARSEFRQVAFVDNAGGTAAHTGSGCISYAGHIELDGAVAQANLMAEPGVPESMAASWEATAGEALAWRLLDALDAAEEAGGDLRGRQSTALRVAEPDSETWYNGVTIDLRVDDHPEPLEELRRLVHLGFAYSEGDKAEEYDSEGSLEQAEGAFRRAHRLLPEAIEMVFWRGVTLVNEGRIDEGKAALASAFAHGERWRELLTRLPAAGRLDVDDVVLAELRRL